MRRIASGVTDQYVYFNSGGTGFSSFTVYRSRNGAAAAAMTTPTINETDSTNMPGVYELLLDEDMSVAAGNLTEHMAFWVTAAGMPAEFIEVELFDPSNYTIGTVTTNTDMVGTDSAALASVCTEARLAELDAANLPATTDGIKTKTDSLTFTTANEVDANIQSINDAAVTGDGNATPWDGA